jgi:hypothetical protein
MSNQTSNPRFKTLSIVEQTEGKRIEKEKTKADELTVFKTGETKTLTVNMLDGSKHNFAYAQYLSSSLAVEKDDSPDINKTGNQNRIITIHFAAHTIKIYGYCLDAIFDTLSTFTLKSITAHDQRYHESLPNADLRKSQSHDQKTQETIKPFITKIDINWRGRE